MYGKIFTQIYSGTLATRGPWQALITFQQLIILADKHGIVDATPEVLSRQTTIPLTIIKTGLRALEKPDPDSRTPDEGGRRIVRLSNNRSWGWRIVNYEKYRVLRSQDERTEYHRRYWQKKRSPKTRENVDSTHSTNSSLLETQQDSTNSTKAVSSKQKVEGERAPAREAVPFPIGWKPGEQTLAEVEKTASHNGMDRWSLDAATAKFAAHSRAKGFRVENLDAEKLDAEWEKWIIGDLQRNHERGNGATDPKRLAL